MASLRRVVIHREHKIDIKFVQRKSVAGCISRQNGQHLSFETSCRLLRRPVSKSAASLAICVQCICSPSASIFETSLRTSAFRASNGNALDMALFAIACAPQPSSFAQRHRDVRASISLIQSKRGQSCHEARLWLLVGHLNLSSLKWSSCTRFQGSELNHCALTFHMPPVPAYQSLSMATRLTLI